MTEPTLEHLNRLVGDWDTEATHRAFPGLTVRGTVAVSWLEGERFLIHRARTDHPEFPDSISIVGNMDHDSAEGLRAGSTSGLRMHYFDSRGVFRAFGVTVDREAWRISREDPSFPQRFAGTFSPDGATIEGVWQLRQDDGRWHDDLRITYRRRTRLK